MVSVLALYSDDLSSNPAEVYSLNSVNLLEKNEKRPTATSTPRLKRLSAKFGSKIATIEPLSKILSNHKI